MTYINSRKRLLKYKLAEKVLASDANFQKANDDKKMDMIVKKLHDDTWCEEHIDPFMDDLHKKKLPDVIAVFKQYDVLDDSIDPIAQKEIDAVERRKNELLDYDPSDPDEGTIIDRMQEKIRDGKLDTSDTKELVSLIDDILDDMSGNGKYSFYTKYIPLLSIFGGTEQLQNEIYASGQYESLVQYIRDTLLDVRDSLEK